MYGYATGWLKWTRDAALDAPFPDIELALKGLGDFVVATTPGAKKEPPKPKNGKEMLNRFRAAFGGSVEKTKGAG